MHQIEKSPDILETIILDEDGCQSFAALVAVDVQVVLHLLKAVADYLRLVCGPVHVDKLSVGELESKLLLSSREVSHLYMACVASRRTCASHHEQLGLLLVERHLDDALAFIAVDDRFGSEVPE